MYRWLAPVLATTAAIALVAGAVARVAAAEDPITWYVVEMIVFERVSDAGRSAEAWPAEPGLPNLADAIELSAEGMAPGTIARDASPATGEATQPPGETVTRPMGAMPRAYRLVPPEEYRLGDVVTRLERSGAYRALLHVAWIQPGYPIEDAPLVHLRNANAALGAVAPAASAEPSAGSPAGAPLATPAETPTTRPAATPATRPTTGPTATPAGTGESAFTAGLAPRINVARDPSKPAVDGTVRVHRARFLHVEADLLYYRPLAGDAGGAPPAAAATGAAPLADSPDTAFIEQLLAEEDGPARLFRLTERRRMRSKELHYLDHPLFGVLVEAWPLELPEAPAEPLPAEKEGDTVAPPAPTQPATGG